MLQALHVLNADSHDEHVLLCYFGYFTLFHTNICVDTCMSNNGIFP